MDDRSRETDRVDRVPPDVGAESTTGSNPKARAGLVLGASMVLAIGVLLGFLAAYTSSRGDLSSSLGALFLGLLIAAIIGLTAVFGAIAAVFQRSRRIGVGALAVAGILGLGVLVGAAFTPVLGSGFRTPISLEARGTASARLDDGVAFTLVEPGHATCRSEPGGEMMTRIELDLGSFGPGPLRGSVSISEPGSAEAWVELRGDSADDAEGAFQPEWIGSSVVTELSERGASGRVSFQRLPRGSDTGPRGDPEHDAWPATLSGSLSWSCGAPRDPLATAPPSRSGRIELHLDGVDWSQPRSGPNATCHYESSSYVIGNDVGLLQGFPVEVRLEGLSGPREFLLSIRLSGKEPPPGQPYFPNWDGQVRHELGVAGNASGSASFSDLATGVDPGVAPLDGWPLSLTGSIAWDCGD